MMAKDPQKQAKRDKDDLVSAIVVGALVIGLLLYTGIRHMVTLFSAPGAITVEAPLGGQPITANIGTGAEATVSSATLVVQNVNVISIGSLVLAVALSTACLIAATVLSVLVCRRLLKGVIFDRTNTNLTAAVSMCLLAAGLVGPWFENMGLNGVFAALNGEFDGQWQLFFDRAPLFVAAITAGVLVIVFQRGATLQKDAEGLV